MRSYVFHVTLLASLACDTAAFCQLPAERQVLTFDARSTLKHAEADGLKVQVLSHGALAVELTDGEGFPALTFRPNGGGRWDLSAKRYVEIELTNNWHRPLILTCWALSPGGWGGASTYPLNPGGREEIAPGATANLRIDLHARYPGPDACTKAIDPADVDRIQLVFHVRQAKATLEVKGLRVTGDGPREPHDVSRRLIIPPASDDPPSAGKRTRQSLPQYADTDVRHVLYLPRDWMPGRRYPIIVEYTGNVFYHKFCYSTGRAEDGKLAYGLANERGFICVNAPFVSADGKREQINGWGSVEKTVDYCLDAVRDVCERFGGDPSAVFVTGFSRGALACNVIALHDDRIADLWLGFDKDPARKWRPEDGNGWGNSGIGWDERAARVRGRATFGEAPNFGAGVHVDVDYLEPHPSTLRARQWLRETVRTRPGTRSVRGRVVDQRGNGLAGVRVQSGYVRFCFSGPDGRYDLPGLIGGERSVVATPASGGTVEPRERVVVIADADVDGVDFTLRPGPGPREAR